MIAGTRELLDALEPLPYRKRLHHVAAWVRDAPDREAVCAELRAGGPYERHLALIAAMVVRDTAAIKEATADPAPYLRAVAIDAALRAGVAGDRVADLSAVDRRRLYQLVRRLRRPELADRLILDVLVHHGPEEAAAILPACGEDTVRSLLPDLEHLVNLGALARNHPGLVRDRIRDRLAAAEPRHRSWIWSETIRIILRGDPETAFDLLERFGPEESLPGSLSAYTKMADHDPDRTARLMTTHGRRAWLVRTTVPAPLLRRLAVLPDDRLAPLARLIRDRSLPGLLRALPPSRRAAIYDAALDDVDTGKRIPSADEMDVLPATVRIREATRVLALPAIRDAEAKVFLWSSYLAYPDAAAALEPAVRAGDAFTRGRGYALLIAAALRSRDPRVVAEVTERLRWLRNDQDPVRLAALNAFAAAAPLLTAGTAPGLARITTDVVEARDASVNTIRALGRLAAGVLQHHVDVPELAAWALATIDRASTAYAEPLLHRFDLVLRRSQGRLVFDRLRPWVEAAIARGSYRPLFALTEALGGWAADLPELQEMLRRACDPATTETTARRAAELWLDDRRTRGERVAEVLAVHPSAARIPIVWNTVCARRTDLLDAALTGALAGTSAGAKVDDWTPPSVPYPERWLPRQQRRFATLMAAIAEDPDRPVWGRAAALRAAGRMPVAGRELLRRYLDSSEVVLSEAALGALIWTDRPDEALPELLAHAGGDRARVALYAAGRAVRHIPPSGLPRLLAPILTGPAKVTSRKEAIRLLARYGPPGALTTLLDVYRQEGQHRDVRAAIVSTARQHLDNEISWTIIDAAASGSREERNAVLAAEPCTVPVAYRPRYAALIAGACRGPDREVRRLAYQRLPRWAPWSDDLTGLLVDRLTDLGEHLDGDETSRLMADAGSGWLDGVFARLADQDAAGPLPGQPDPPAAGRGPAFGQSGHVVAGSGPAFGQSGHVVAGSGPAFGQSGHVAAGSGPALGQGDHVAAVDVPDPSRVGQPAIGVGPGQADRPARRRIELIVRSVTRGSSSVARAELIPEIRRLADRPGYLRLALIALVDLGRLDNLPEIAGLCAGRPAVAVDVAQRAGMRMRQLPDLIDAEFLAPLIARLTARGDLAGGLIALSLAGVGATFGWGRPWRELLLALRAHPDPDVSEAAYGIDMG